MNLRQTTDDNEIMQIKTTVSQEIQSVITEEHDVILGVLLT